MILIVHNIVNLVPKLTDEERVWLRDNFTIFVKDNNRTLIQQKVVLPEQDVSLVFNEIPQIARLRWSFSPLHEEFALSVGEFEENSDIEELIVQYTEECCDFTDMDYVRRAAQRHVKTMPDCLTRCLLHVLSK
jgi:hypothetical protein